jgi:hypothetical protein
MLSSKSRNLSMTKGIGYSVNCSTCSFVKREERTCLKSEGRGLESMSLVYKESTKRYRLCSSWVTLIHQKAVGSSNHIKQSGARMISVLIDKR